jgi:amino acid transporter
MSEEVALPLEIVDASETGLANRVLGTWHVMAESIGMIGPSLSAAALIPLIFLTAGGAAWLTCVVGTVGMLAVAVIINEFSKRHVSTGALYTLIPKGLGPPGGLLAAGGFVLIALAGQIISVFGFGIAFAQFLTSAFSIGSSSRVEVVVISLLGLLLATYVVLRGIRLSTSLLLLLEGASVVAISALLLIILAKHGHIFDSTQLELRGATPHGVLVGMTFIILSLGGFESATALGVEAKEPRKAIPIALFGAVALAGLFFICNAYIQVLGFEGTGINIASQAIPLGTLAIHYRVSWLGDIVLLGVSLSWFSVLCAWLNYAPRPLVAMADEGVIPKWFGRVHKKTGAPNAAIYFWATAYLVISLYIVFANVSLTEAFGNIGALAGYGYTFMYLLMALAALAYGFRHGVKKAWYWLAAVVAGGVMILVYWYSFIPMPASPVDLFVYSFLVYVGLLLVCCVVAWLRAPNWLRRMGTLEEKESSVS